MQVSRLNAFVTKNWVGWSLGGLIALQCSLLLYSARVHSPTWDEVGHLAAGVSHWELGRFDLYSVNPPLVRTLAAAPVVLFDKPKMDWDYYRSDPKQRSEIFLGRRMMQLNGERIVNQMFLARLAVMPIALIGTVYCFLWGHRLFGAVAGLVAACLWALSPMVLAYGSVITPDLASAVVLLVASYCLWGWLKQPSWSGAICLTAATGTAMLTKSIWLLLPPFFFALWASVAIWPSVQRLMSRIWRKRAVDSNPTTSLQTGSASIALVNRSSWKFTRLIEGVQLAVVWVGAFTLVNGFYGFRGSFSPLGEYAFISRALAGPSNCEGCGEQLGNRFRQSNLLASLPVPLPANYLEGIDIQRRDFERGATDVAWQSYLFGRWQHGGWWYFYVVGLFVKTPLIVWCLLIISTFSLIAWRADRDARLGMLCLWAPALALLALLSFNTGLNRYVRYALPVLPAICIGSAAVARWLASESSALRPGSLVTNGQTPSLLPRPAWQRYATDRPVLGALLTGACGIMACVSIGNAPHWLSYFNMVAGGPANGHRVLADSNVDWGQDLLMLKKWLASHPDAASDLHLAAFTSYDPVCLGIEYELPPPVYGDPSQARSAISTLQGPNPGWFVVSKNYLAGHVNPAPDGTNRMQFEYLGQSVYEYFNEFEPVDQIGQSMLVYKLEPEEVDRVRSKLKLAALRHKSSGTLAVEPPSTNQSSGVLASTTP